LLGDAAHCTGGVSGQGCSSAMKDDALRHCSAEVGKSDLGLMVENNILD